MNETQKQNYLALLDHVLELEAQNKALVDALRLWDDFDYLLGQEGASPHALAVVRQEARLKTQAALAAAEEANNDP